MKQLSLVVIPLGIEQMLKMSSTPLSALTDIEKLSGILSKEDVAFYIYCQHLITRQTSIGIKAVVDSFGSNLVGGRIFNTFYEKVHNGYALVESFELQNPNNYIRPLYDGSFDFDKGGLDYRNYTFETVEIESDVLGLRLVPLVASDPAEEQEESALSDLLNVLSNYLGFNDMVKKPAFDRFVYLKHR